MNLHGVDIEFKLEHDEFDDNTEHHHYILQFVRTPKGRRKVLFTVTEEVVYPQHPQEGYGKLSRFSFSFSHTKNKQERAVLRHTMLAELEATGSLLYDSKSFLQHPLVPQMTNFFVEFAEKEE